MQLQQNQVWHKGDEYIRIVHVERLGVVYKTMKDLVLKEGTRHQVTKKEFCHLIKGATLLPESSRSPEPTDAPTVA